MSQPSEVFKAIPPLLLRFLRRRRVGVTAPDELAQELGIEREDIFTLAHVRYVHETHECNPVTPAQIRAWDPYETADNTSDAVTKLVERGLLLEDAEGGITFSVRARDVMERLQDAGRAHVARLLPPGGEDLEALAGQLDRAIEGVIVDPVLAPRPGSHLAAYRALRVTGDDAPAMVRIEQSIFELWGARDDAHMRAWREAGMEGPAMPVLTALWRGEANSVSALREAMPWRSPADLESSLAYLLDKNYITRDDDSLLLTPEGVLAREDIERETDRIYFAPWPQTEAEAAWIRDKLTEMVDNLEAAPKQ